jgi:PST family polysaccharide transporter
LCRYFLAGYSVIISCVLPIAATCAVFSEELVSLMLGPQWHAAAPVFRWLAIGGLAVGLLNPQGMLLIAMGRASRCVVLGIADAVCVIAGYVAGLSYGPVGIAVGFAAVKFLICVPMTRATFRDTPVLTGQVWRTIFGPAVAVALACLAGAGFQALAVKGIGHWWLLILGALVMMITYAVMLLFVLGNWEFYRGILREILPARGAKAAIPANL